MAHNITLSSFCIALFINDGMPKKQKALMVIGTIFLIGSLLALTVGSICTLSTQLCFKATYIGSYSFVGSFAFLFFVRYFASFRPHYYLWIPEIPKQRLVSHQQYPSPAPLDFEKKGILIARKGDLTTHPVQELENFVQFLEKVKDDFINYDVFFSDYPETSGPSLKRDFLDDLFTATLEHLNRFFPKQFGFPKAREHDQDALKILQNLGKVMKMCFSKLLIGYHFDPAFFVGIIMLSHLKQQPFENLANDIKRSFYDVYSWAKQDEDINQARSKLSLDDAYKYSEETWEDEFRAIYAVAEGMKSIENPLWDLVLKQTTDYETISTILQGKIKGANIAARILLAEGAEKSEEVVKKHAWLIEWISESASSREIRQFLKFATGSSGLLLQGRPISVRQKLSKTGDSYTPFPSAMTCLQLIELSPEPSSKEEFIQVLRLALNQYTSSYTAP